MEVSHGRGMTAEAKPRPSYHVCAEVPFYPRVRNTIFLYPRAKVRSLISREKSKIIFLVLRAIYRLHFSLLFYLLHMVLPYARV